MLGHYTTGPRECRWRSISGFRWRFRWRLGAPSQTDEGDHTGGIGHGDEAQRDTGGQGDAAARASSARARRETTAPARVRRLTPDRLEIVLHEGRNHIVRRTMEAVGHPVRRLSRGRSAR